MDRKIFKEFFVKEKIEGWPCPTCGGGTLVGKSEKFLSECTIDSKFVYDEVGDPEDLDISFSVVLECSNSKCKETVFCIGRGSPSYETLIDEIGNYEPNCQSYFYPLFFHPSLNIFAIPDDVPPLVRQYLSNSFEVFFCNPRLSLNCVRLSLEAILDFLNVRKFFVKDKKRIRINLHQRVDL